MESRLWKTAAGVTSFAFSAASSAGRVRTINEDSFLANPPVFIVADGMGGHSRGDEASAAAVQEFSRRIVGSRAWQPSSVLDAIEAAAAAVAAIPVDEGQVAGTTLSGIVLVSIATPLADDLDAATVEGVADITDLSLDYRWMVANVGDSRVYLLDETGLRQVTVDHSLVQELVTAGTITEEDARSHPDRNVITRALGIENRGEPDFLLLPVSPGQTFLICSDGVSGSVARVDLERILRDEDDPADVAQRIVDLALNAGSRDNATAVVVRATVDPDAGAQAVEDTRPTFEVAP